DTGIIFTTVSPEKRLIEETISALESSSPPEALRRKIEALPRYDTLNMEPFYIRNDAGRFIERRKVLTEIDAELGKATEEAGR
ncbi:MAG: hypothetical protein KGI38_12615, partial [Thaumarchaeota archaeon]|nr:hypothetical protein [Nitrososphaerota archaeon]